MEAIVVMALICVLTAWRVFLRGAVAILGPIDDQRRAEAAERARLAFDADHQNAAYLSGDLSAATHGRFQPSINSIGMPRPMTAGQAWDKWHEGTKHP